MSTARPAARPIRPGELVTAIRSAHARLGGAIEPVTGAQVVAPSRLPGWSRGHVLAHLAGVGGAAARQVGLARRGVLVDLCDGGRPARDAAIEAGARASAAALVVALRIQTERIDELLASLAPADWDRPVPCRDQLVLDRVLAWWREVEVHTTDLDLGCSSDSWSARFCDHLVDHLAALPERTSGTHLVLQAPGWVREVGTGTPRIVRGQRTDLVAWLAGRDPVRPVDGDLPLLAPWT